MAETQNDNTEGNQVDDATTVFFSYSRTDQAQALPLITAIENAGYKVWWDGMLAGGSSFLESTEKALESAKAVVVLWSETSVQSHWVRDEATSGRERGALVPLSLDGTIAPLGFRQVQLINLENWQQNDTASPIMDMLRAIAELHGETGQAPPNLAAAKLAATPPKTRWQMSRRYMFLGGGLLAGAATVGGLFSSGLLKPTSKTLDNSLAVMPFENLSGNPDYDYIAGGLSSEIRNSLSLNPALKVAAKSSSRAAAQDGLDVSQISKKLNVANLIEGSFNVIDNAVRVTVNFIDGTSGFNQWVKKFEHSLENILGIHDDITTAVQETFSLQHEIENNAVKSQTENPIAFNEYLKGHNEIQKSLDEEAVERAINYYNNAISLDPNFGAVYISKSQVLLWQAFSTDDVAQANQFQTEALATAQKASIVSPNFADAYNNLGYIQFFTRLDVQNARISFKTAKKLGGGKPGSLARFATFSAFLGQDQEALLTAEKAIILDPLNPAIHETVALVHYCAKRYEKSIESYERVLELKPNRPGSLAHIAESYYELGEVAKGLSYCEKETSDLERLPCMAIGFDKLQNPKNSQLYLEELIATFGDYGAYQQAQIYANRNDIKNAMTALKKAYELNDTGLSILYVDPNMKSLQENSDYLELLAKIGFQG